MDYKERLETLTDEFEKKLSRSLVEKENLFIQWLVIQEQKEKETNKFPRG